MRLAGRTLDYTATVGNLPVRDAKGKVIADVVFTAYTMPGKDRPVTSRSTAVPARRRCTSTWARSDPRW